MAASGAACLVRTSARMRTSDAEKAALAEQRVRVTLDDALVGGG